MTVAEIHLAPLSHINSNIRMIRNYLKGGQVNATTYSLCADSLDRIEDHINGLHQEPRYLTALLDSTSETSLIGLLAGLDAYFRLEKEISSTIDDHQSITGAYAVFTRVVELGRSFEAFITKLLKQIGPEKLNQIIDDGRNFFMRSSMKFTDDLKDTTKAEWADIAHRATIEAKITD